MITAIDPASLAEAGTAQVDVSAEKA